MIIYLIRHGQAQSNLDEVCAGHQDSPLTQLGIQQAQSTGQTLKHIIFDQVYSSDLSRAYDTAKYILQSDQTIITDTRLRERCYYNYEGTNGLIQQHSDELKIDNWDYIQNGGNGPQRPIESNIQIIARWEGFLKDMIVNNTSQNILITTHGSFGRTITSHITQGTMSTFTSLVNASVTILYYSQEKGLKLISYNNYLHLGDLINQS